MSQIRFEVGDVAAVRFSISPLWETVRSLYALADPGRHWLHRPWVWRVSELAGRRSLNRQLAVLRALARPGAWMPDFLTPAPTGPVMDFTDELTALTATRPEVVVADLAATTAQRPLPAVIEAYRDNAARLLDDIASAADVWHTIAIRPYWSRLLAVLEADVAYRSRQVVEGGARRVFDTLHPSVRWAGDHLCCDDPWKLDRGLRGRGLPLVPSVFVDRRVLWTIRSDSAPIAIYPARGVATLWQRRPGVDDGLANALGRTRARLLSLLRSPATTAELARQVELSRPTVSEHLHSLYGAGLLTRVRAGRTVLYRTSSAGEALLRTNREVAAHHP
jgi:DNA-binding transcriptional ArsR family regulator